MCGIVGIYQNKKMYKKSDIQNMLSFISHRGPDDEGIEVLHEEKLLFGHKRLSILDLSSLAHQPMYNFDKSLCITYNGEIFNFQEIKKQLIKLGYKFKSNSDTEVVLYAYMEYGTKCLNMFRGFFAFCIYDKQKNELFLARDRLGSKPLKYYFDNQIFAFASEIKSFYPIKDIKKSINLDSVSDFLSLKYIQAPKTIFNNIYKLNAGHYITFSLNNNTLKIKKYWEPKFEPKLNISYEEAKEEGQQILYDSISLRMISDVPVGVFLSGGIDSSSIVALLRKHYNKNINTYSMGFIDAKFDERKYAKKIAKIFDTNHKEFLVEPSLENDLTTIINSYDEPFADPSIIPTYYLSKEVSKYVKVALSGDGADEILGGYKRYFIHNRNTFLNYIPPMVYKTNLNILKKIPFSSSKKEFYGKISRIIESISANLTDTYYLRLTGFSKKQKYHILKHNELTLFNNIWNSEIIEYFNLHKNLSAIEKLMAIDQITHLPEYILTKTDILAMANSLEVRSPFIDVKFIDWANKLNIDYKTKSYSKRILKDILQENGVPKDIIHRKKAGFTPPIKEWLIANDELLKYIINDSLILKFFNKDILNKMYVYNKKNNQAIASHLWMIV